MRSARFYASLIIHRSLPADPIDNTGGNASLTNDEARKARKGIAPKKTSLQNPGPGIASRPRLADHFPAQPVTRTPRQACAFVAVTLRQHKSSLACRSVPADAEH